MTAIASEALPQTPLGDSECSRTPSSIYHTYGVIDRKDRNFPDFKKYLIGILYFVGTETKNNYVGLFSEPSTMISDNSSEKKEIKRISVDLIIVK